jgi:paraquat-inducible protein B
MKNRANPKLVGAFVVGAVALAVVGVGVLGSGRLFRQAVPFVLYFPGGVQGLRVGAPVKFKGVEVGSVTNILLNLDQPVSGAAQIPVFIEIDMKKVLRKGGPPDLEDPAVYRKFVEWGLRAQLESESLLTGQLFVQLDFHPEIPPRFVQPPDYRYRELPTVPNTLERAGLAVEELLAELRRANISGLARSATQALDGIHRFVDSAELQADVVAVAATLRGADRAVADLRRVASHLDQQAAPLLASLASTSEQTRQAVARADSAIVRADAALGQLQATLADARAQVEPGSPVSTRLLRTLDETAAAARSVRELADYLQRNPTALLLGRPAAAEPR